MAGGEEAASVSSWTDTGSVVSPSPSIDSAYTVAADQHKHSHYHHQPRGSRRRSAGSEARVSVVNEREPLSSFSASVCKPSTAGPRSSITAVTATTDVETSVSPSSSSDSRQQEDKRRTRARSGFPLFVLAGGRSNRRQQQPDRAVHL